MKKNHLAFFRSINLSNIIILFLGKIDVIYKRNDDENLVIIVFLFILFYIRKRIILFTSTERECDFNIENNKSIERNKLLRKEEKAQE